MPELIAPTVRLHTAWLEAGDEWGPGVHEDGFGLRRSDEVDSPAGFAAWVAWLADESDRPKPVDAGPGALHVPMDRRERSRARRDRAAARAQRLRAAGRPYRLRHPPSARRRGLATWVLGRMLGEARVLGLDRALTICDVDNIASAKTIERHGGVLEDVREPDTELRRGAVAPPA